MTTLFVNTSKGLPERFYWAFGIESGQNCNLLPKNQDKKIVKW